MPFGIQKLRTDVYEAHVRNILQQLRKIGIELDDLLAMRMGKLPATGEHRHYEDFHFWINFVELLGNRLHPVGRLPWMVAAPANIVRANHQRSRLGGRF